MIPYISVREVYHHRQSQWEKEIIHCDVMLTKIEDETLKSLYQERRVIAVDGLRRCLKDYNDILTEPYLAPSPPELKKGWLSRMLN